MQRNRSRILILLALITVTAIVVAQDKKPLSPAGQASLTFADGHTVTIDYSRPSMRNRKILADSSPMIRSGARAPTRPPVSRPTLISPSAEPRFPREAIPSTPCRA